MYEELRGASVEEIGRKRGEGSTGVCLEVTVEKGNGASEVLERFFG